MCTVFGRVEEGRTLVGRSFDWVQYGGNICFVPPYRCYGISTIGCAFIEQMGEDRAYEGINTEGLFVAVVALPTYGGEEPKESPLVINSLSMVKFLLERARNSAEALEIVKSFSIDYKIKYGLPKVQYFFADRQGIAGIYEENVFEELVELDSETYRVLTNKSATSRNSCKRELKVRKSYEFGKALDSIAYREMVSSVCQEGLTAWSSVYDLEKRSFSLWIEGNFEDEYKFKLEDCLKDGRFSVDFAELKLNTKVTSRKRNSGYSKIF